MAMKPKIRIGAMAAVGAAVLAISTVVAVTPSIAATGPAPISAGARYLALGDSIAFGYREPHSVQTPNPEKPNTFVGYPELIANNLDLKLTNAACPGETTASFIDTTRPDNGCTTDDTGGPGWRTAGFPLHATYASASQSQLDFAIAYLKAHPGTKLVTLQIGANDGLRCINLDQCTTPTELAEALAAVQKRLTRILNNIKNKGGYSGQLVLVNYYSVNSASEQQNELSHELNLAELQVAGNYSNVTVADAFSQYASASKNAPGTTAGGDTCVAGLETILTDESSGNENCGIHPSRAGQALIAGAVERVVSKP
ncbi:MAG TPA: SGNH/GDSL hydrolase family protein [Jatrophihabitantaceae bacterium]|jgi:lysophospholipase L1-like esterase